MSPSERLQNFLSQMHEWEVGFHAEKRCDAYKTDSGYRTKANEAAKSRLEAIFSENLSVKASIALGSARLDTLGTGQPPEYEQTILTDTEEQLDKETNIQAVRKKGLKQRYRYTVIVERDEPKIDGVSVWRASSEKWERRHAI
ncbi:MULTISPECIES: NTF2 fold immunity protein [unclassified Pseudomonas]|jgi:hypothetical protein|uniref:NTF2 fold immunity protein n=1 Tax=Pseudomonas sp. R84 TaxID=1573712 RepID=UPI000C99E0B0|nr:MULTISPECIES: NTF2 fold immunity protein [Pseudomonas]PNG41871.1 hypothetical protein A1354_27765 [Pseudomonas asplenii]QHC95617.1 hypothetical protein PspR84_13505 [Pseudomonas sp. R84]